MMMTGPADNSPCQRTLAFALAMQSTLSFDDVAAEFLNSVHHIIDAESFGLYRLHADSGRVLDVHAQVKGRLLEEYEESGRRDDPILAYVLEHHRPFDSSQMCLTRWRGSGAHAVLEASGFEHSLEAPIVVGRDVVGTINFARSGDLPAFTDVDLCAASHVAEHLGLALQRARYVEQLARRSNMFESALERVADTVVIADCRGRVQFRNRPAAALFGAAPDFHRAAAPAITQAVESACEAIHSHGKRVVVQDVEAGGQSYVARTVRLPDRAQAVMTTLHARTPSPDSLPVWSVLTPREQQIAALASEGLTTRQIAQRAFISENTVKQHLKRIYAKTDVSNRAELVQLIWASTHAPVSAAAAAV